MDGGGGWMAVLCQLARALQYCSIKEYFYFWASTSITFFSSAFLWNFFLCLSDDVPPHLVQPCYVALGRALIWGLYPDWLWGITYKLVPIFRYYSITWLDIVSNTCTAIWMRQIIRKWVFLSLFYKHLHRQQYAGCNLTFFVIRHCMVVM